MPESFSIRNRSARAIWHRRLSVFFLAFFENVQKNRALVILGCIAGTCGLISGIASSESVNIASSKKDKKRAAGGSAGCFSVAGFLILAATSWAAHSIIRRYKMLTMGGGGYGGGMQVNAASKNEMKKVGNEKFRERNGHLAQRFTPAGALQQSTSVSR